MIYESSYKQIARGRRRQAHRLCHIPRPPRARPPRDGPPRAPPRPRRRASVHHRELMGKRREVKQMADLVGGSHCDLSQRTRDERAMSKRMGTRRTSSYATGMCTTPRALTRFSCARLFLLDHVQQCVWYTQVLYLPPQNKTARNQLPRPLQFCRSVFKTHRATPDVTLFDFPKPVAVRVGLVYLAKRDVHKVVAVDEVSIERFSVF